MDLPILNQSAGIDTNALVRAAKRAETILCRTMASEYELDSAIVFSNPQRPDTPLANRATDISFPDNVAPQSILDQITAQMQTLGTQCHSLSCSNTKWPDAFTQAASSLGYKPTQVGVFSLNRYITPAAIRNDIQIIPARSSYNDLRSLYAAWAGQMYPHSTPTAEQTTECMVDQLDEPRIDAFIGRHKGKPVGVAAVLSLGQVGVIRSVYTTEGHRGRGVSRTLMAHTLDYCIRAQFTQVILTTKPSSPASKFFEAIGFVPVAEYVDYILT